MGLLEEPIMPTRLPETAAKKKPVMAITMAAMTAAVTFPENQKYTAIIAKNATARPPKTTRMFMSRSRRLVAAAAVALDLEVLDGAAHALGEVLAHLEQGGRRSDEHSAHGDGTHDELPDGENLIGPEGVVYLDPVCGGVRR